MLASISFVVVILLLLLTILSAASSSSLNLTLPHQHPHPQSVIDDLHRRVNASITRRQMLGEKAAEDSSQCLTGNPIDDCWKCDDWPNNRKRLADCAVGFGSAATGGKGGQIYTVTDSSDRDVVNPIPGTLRYAVIQEQPLWIIFATDMTINLKHELILTSYKTLDGRGRQVHITGNGCLTLQYISDIIIHNIHIHHCKPSGNVIIRSSPTHVGFRGRSDGDGISISGSRNIWIDHCSLSYCTDGLIDAIMGSTAITISNNYFSNHNDVMLFGHNDEYLLDVGMQITIAFNRFGERLVQRMPRCRRGLIHVVNNDFTGWGIYAIGGSANPTINSQGNRYTAPSNTDAKEVTKRVDTDANGWSNWNWRSEGDIMVNGAFFVPSGASLNTEYAPALSFQPKSAAYIDQFTVNVGVMGDSSGSNPIRNQGGYTSGSGGDGNTVYTGGNGNGGGEYFGFFGSNGVTLRSTSSITSPIVCLSLVVSSVFILIGPLRHQPM